MPTFSGTSLLQLGTVPSSLSSGRNPRRSLRWWSLHTGAREKARPSLCQSKGKRCIVYILDYEERERRHVNINPMRPCPTHVAAFQRGRSAAFWSPPTSLRVAHLLQCRLSIYVSSSPRSPAQSTSKSRIHAPFSTLSARYTAYVWAHRGWRDRGSSGEGALCLTLRKCRSSGRRVPYSYRSTLQYTYHPAIVS